MDVSKYLVLGLCVIALNSQAEIYHWVDKDGKVHFTDKKPAPDAENITKEVKTHNLDTSSTEIQKITLKREQEEKQRQEQRLREWQERKPEVDKQRQVYCEKQKERLRKISGYIVFVDENGRSVKVTEQERQQKVAELKQVIQDTCG
ncbi:MAG: DUF4124 domain-containing protein [Cellvibrio sp.]|uniref:DUF4124 domain-containing protein n=1 Tax=Cellvibrio sp. TaxID=1965322 RepID=UPI0031A3F871